VNGYDEPSVSRAVGGRILLVPLFLAPLFDRLLGFFLLLRTTLIFTLGHGLPPSEPSSDSIP